MDCTRVGFDRGWAVTDIEQDLKALGAERRRLGEQLRDEQRRQKGRATSSRSRQARLRLLEQRQRPDDTGGEQQDRP
jgi:hypothetical protein